MVSLALPQAFSFFSFSPFLIGLLGSIPACINLDDIVFYLSTNHRHWEYCQLSLGAPYLQKSLMTAIKAKRLVIVSIHL